MLESLKLFVHLSPFKDIPQSHFGRMSKLPQRFKQLDLTAARVLQAADER